MSDNDSDDSDLRRAIALSLQEADSPSVIRKPDTRLINLISDDEDDDFDKTVARPRSVKDGNTRPPRSIRGNVNKTTDLNPTQGTHVKPADSERGNDGTLSEGLRSYSGPSPLEPLRTYREPHSGSSMESTDFGQAKNEKSGGCREPASKLKMPESSPSQVGNLSQPLYGLSSILGLDRKKMEEERITRARKRKAMSISPPPLNQMEVGAQQEAASLGTGDKDGVYRAAKRVTVRLHS
jgi:Ubiquitin interaction motif